MDRTETKATHSELPWHLQEDDGDVWAGKYRVARTFGGRNPLLESWGDGVLANAEYIVRACNTFPALLEAAEAAQGAILSGAVAPDGAALWALPITVEQRLRDAIAAARG